MKLYSLIVALMLFLPFVAHAQAAPLPERLSMMTDRSDYQPGQQIQMSVFMTDVATKSVLRQSQYVYVELLDESDVSVKRVMLKSDNGMFHGNLTVPADYPAGTAHLRAYTLMNANVPALECVNTVVIGTETAVDCEPLAECVRPNIFPVDMNDSIAVGIVFPEEVFNDSIRVAVSITPDSAATPMPIANSLSRAAPKKLPQKRQPQMSQQISGYVTGKKGEKIFETVEVMLLAPQADFFMTTKAGPQGDFVFNNLELADSTMIFLQATGNRRNTDLILNVDIPSFPSCNYNIHDAIRQDAGDDNIIYADFEENAIMLRTVEVKAQILEDNTDRTAFSMLADFSFNQKKLEEIDATSIEDVLRRVPGVYIDPLHHIIIRGRGSIYGDSYAAIAVDGTIMEGDYFDLYSIPMQDIYRVDVFKSGSTVIWGSVGGSGVVSITTKSGTFNYERSFSPNIKKVFPFGFQQARTFRPSTRTFYWNPVVTTTGQDAVVVRIPKVPSAYIHIEGITDSGKAIYLNQKIRP